jgi:hypothetical protein
MQIEFTRKFQKQIDSCTDKRIKLKIAEIIREIIRTESMIGFNNLKN